MTSEVNVQGMEGRKLEEEKLSVRIAGENKLGAVAVVEKGCFLLLHGKLYRVKRILELGAGPV